MSKKAKSQAHFGNTLRAAMEAQEMTQAELARVMDRHAQYISDITNKANVTTITESRVAQALGLTMSEFWSFSE